MAFDVPKFMNALVADLQSDAWDSDVKLVLDASTPITSDVDTEGLKRHLARVLAGLIRASRRDGTISVVTSHEAAEDDPTRAQMHVILTASLSRPAGLAPAVAEFKAMAESFGGAVAAPDGDGPGVWSLTASFPCHRGEARAPHQRIAVVVDDDVDMQDFLSIVLEAKGFKVVAVNDGFDALIVIDRYQPDVVLTDLFMPNMDGFDLVGRIKQARADLPVIVFTGYYDSLREKEGAFGATRPDFVLPKPMTQAEVATALDKVFAARR